MYPLFQVPWAGGPMLIAAIATFHILPSHVATGAFWITYYVERKAYAEERPELLEFLKKFTLSILVFCFVTGSLSGVGIWYAVTVVNPRAISGIVHNYVWGWATEWVFFIIEIATVYVYYYTFGKVSRKTHLRIGLIYALAAWMSLAVITGILGFMLTPGRWPETGGFFDGFFSETFWPQLLLRTSMMFAIAGAYAAAVAAAMTDGGRDTVRRLAGRWGLAGLAAGGACALWYWAKLPDHSKDVLGSVAYAGIALKVAVGAGVAMGLYFLALAVGRGAFATPVVAVGMMGILFVGVGGGESVREIVRRPWVIPGYMYSNQIVGADMPAKAVASEVPALNRDGLLAHHPFVPFGLRAVTAVNYLEAGEAVVRIECLACHTLEAGGRNSLVRRYRNVATESGEIYDHLGILGNYSYMPPFVGTDRERRAAAAYLAGLTGGAPADPSWVAGETESARAGNPTDGRRRR